MSLKFWLGGARSDKSRRLIKYILQDAGEHPDRQYLYVVPEQFGLSTQQELVMESKNHGILNIDVLSFTRLAHRISDEVGAYKPDITTLDDMGKSLLIGMLAGQMKKDLAVFADDLDKLGCIDRIKSVISEYMQYGITVDKAFEMSQTAKDKGRILLSEKLKDVANIYKAFKEYITDRYTTVEETLDTVSRLVPHSTTIKNSVVVFDGFTGFTPVQNKLIGVLLEYARSVHVALLLEDCIQKKTGKERIREHELFYLSKNTMDQLGRMADERRVIIDDPYNADKHEISNTCNSKGKDVYTNNSNAQKLNNTSVHLFAGQNPDEEIRMVMARMIGLIKIDGYRYKDIAILTGDISSYRRTIERPFDKHGIPFFIDATEPILLNPFIEYIRSFIDIISDNYSISAVFGFLKSGLAGFVPDEINLLENYCLAANIKGYKAWQEPFTGKTQTTKEDDLPILNGIRERLAAKCNLFTQCLTGSCNSADQALNDTGGTRVSASTLFTVAQFATALYNLIDSDDIEEKLKEASEDLEATGNRADAARYAGIYVKIMNILDELCELIPDEKTDIRGFGRLLDAGFDSIRIGILPTGMDYVQVGDLTRSRIGDVKALFIVGANDGIIPMTGSKSGIINDSERDFLVENDDKLVLAPGERENIFTQQLYIYMATNKPSEHLFVSYSRTSASGKSLLPSYLIKKLKCENPGVSVETKTQNGLPMDEEEAFDEMTDLIYPALSGTISDAEFTKLKEYIAYFRGKDNYKERLSRIIGTQILNSATGPGDSIGAALAHAIYGRRIDASITRLENYAKCAYRYFLQYGLSLKEREIFSFEAKDMGNIFHDSMKEYSGIITRSGRDWVTTSPEERDALMDEAVDTVIRQYRTEKLSSSARYAYVEQRIRRIMKRSAEVISAQLEKGEFTPKYFEVDFDTMGADDTISMSLSDDDMLRLRGRIDRIDTCETDDGIYVRVIDYKSSHHEMDLAAIYEGRQLQLLVYLGAAKSITANAANPAEPKTGELGETKPVIPAGVFYYHINDPMITSKTELSADEVQNLIMKKLCLNGLVNRDPDVLKLNDRDIIDDSTVVGVSFTSKGTMRSSKQAVSGATLDLMTQYVTDKIGEMGSEILAGNIAIPEPDNRTRFTGPDCAFCPYTSICGRGTASGGVFGTDMESDLADKEAGKEKEAKPGDDWLDLMKKKTSKDKNSNGTDS